MSRILTKAPINEAAMATRPTTREQPLQLEPCVESGVNCTVPPSSSSPIATNQHCNDDDVFAPSGVEAHPEGWRVVRLNLNVGRYRRCGIILFALLAVTCVVLGTVVGRRLQKDKPQPPALSMRATAGIAETMQQFWQRHSLPLDGSRDGPTTPFEKALDWIQNVDSLALRTTDANLIQRFIVVYFYFATSTQQQPWTTDCLVREDDSTNDDDCRYQLFHSGSTPRFAAYKWLSGRNECDWAGITCDVSHQVIALEIGGMNMTGSIPEPILLLPFLQTLVLNDNQLTGPLPATLHNAGAVLQTLNLNGNRLVGSIPDSWYETLRTIASLKMADNQLTGTLSARFGELSNLKRLSLNDNKMTGALPTEVGDLQSITYFQLNGNAFHGAIPTTLGRIAHLSEAWLHRNRFSGSIPTELGAVKSLKTLRLSSNALNGTIPQELYNVFTLSELDLSDNALSGTLSTLVGSAWPGLTMLRLENNHFYGTLPTELGLLWQLREFSASGNDLTGTVPKKLCRNRRSATASAGSSKVLKVIQVDCAAAAANNDANGTALMLLPEIVCPVGCCSQCCDVDGANCVPMLE